MKIALCLPAILDENLINETTKSIRQNIVNCNEDVNFIAYVNIDNYKRSNGSGTLESIEKIYNQNLSSKNCKVDINISGKRLGLNLAYKHLIQSFFNSDCDYCVFFDDDHFIINKIIIKDFYKKMVDDNIMIHLDLQ